MKKIHFTGFGMKFSLKNKNKAGRRKNTVKQTRKKTIKGKLFLRFLATTVAICITFGVLTILLLYTNTKQNIQSEVKLAATSYSTAIKNSIDKYFLGANVIASNPDILSNSVTAEEKKEKVGVLSRGYGFYSATIADKDGKTLDGENINKEDYFKSAKSGSAVVTSTYQSKKSNGMFVSFSVPLENLKGVAVCNLASGILNGFISNIKIGKSGYGFIVDSNGKIIAHKNIRLALKSVNYIEMAKKDASYSQLSGLVKRMTAGETGFLSTRVDGEKAIIGYAPIKGTTGWSVGVVGFQDEMMGSLMQAIYITLALIVLFILLSVLLSRSIALPIITPILSLVKRIETLSEGDLHTEVPEVHTKDEIQTLSQAFGTTVSNFNNYIGEISGSLDSMAEGDLVVQIQQDYRGDFSPIKNSLNRIISSLNGMFHNISHVSDQVAAGAQQMSSGSQGLAQGATEQAGTIQELSASIHEVTSKAGQNAQNAAGAMDLSEKTLDEVAHGTEQMDRMVTAMEKIGNSSDQIGKIIKTIEDIAFQTNILALNAAVEAARAGKAGKGFAVVADEVRNLAGKSSEAARDTSELIQNSINSVKDGQKIAQETSNSLVAIVDKVQQMSDLIHSISTSATEESATMDQVNEGVEQISAVVQTNSATAEQSAATSEELNKLAQVLKEMLEELTLLEETPVENEE